MNDVLVSRSMMFKAFLRIMF